MDDALTQQSAHIRTVSFEVRVENARAQALYEQLGFRVSWKMRKYYADSAAALEYRARRMPGSLECGWLACGYARTARARANAPRACRSPAPACEAPMRLRHFAPRARAASAWAPG